MPDIMGAGDLAFPHLHIYLRNVPKSFSVFGFEIAMYAVCVTTGFLLAFTLITKLAKDSSQDPDTYWDLFFWLMPVSILGARIYYVIFDWNRLYRGNILQIFNIRDGGLAIYGGIIAGVITVYVFVKKRKLSFLKMGDTIVPGLLLGQAIGRFGNFTNREAFGQYTDNLLAMRIPMSAVYRADEITATHMAHVTDNINYIQAHPTFLYESLWNTGLLLFLLWYFKKKKFDGELILIAFGGYGFGRMWIETLRTDQLRLHYSGLPVSQLLAMLLFVFCATCLITVRMRLRRERR